MFLTIIAILSCYIYMERFLIAFETSKHFNSDFLLLFIGIIN